MSPLVLLLSGLALAVADEPCVGDPPTHSACQLLGLNCSGSSSLDPKQCEFFQELHDSTGGSKWHGCNATRNDPCNCYDEGRNLISYCVDGDLVNLQLNSNNLRGTIPASIGAATNLKYLDLGDNNQPLGGRNRANALHGPIPASIGALTNLELLHLGGSDWLQGGIPAALGGLTKLKSLYLMHNRLTGTIPAELGALSALRVFYLYNNLLSGRVPPLNFTRIGKYCGIGDAKGANDGNKFCTPLPKGASHCNLEGRIKTKGKCS